MSTVRRVVPLIECTEEGEYRACQATMDWISAHDKPFGVVACAGRYRTGKSFFMNQMSQCDKNNGFGVGDTVQACTKGLWVCKHFFPVSEHLDILLVDTEGIDALDATDDGDIRIFTLALLLSTTFIYNSVGHIDEAAMSTLSLMTRVTEQIYSSLGDNPDEHALPRTMPAFHWVLRDFSLKLEDKQGNAIDNATYLEGALEVSDTMDDARGATRRAISQFFQERHLHTLPRPAADIDNLMSKPWTVSSRFHQSIEDLRIKIFNSTRAFQTGTGVPMNGKMYVALCNHMCAHGKSELPMMRDTWAMMSAIHARDAKDAIVQDLRDAVRQWKPQAKDVLRDVGATLVRASLDAFDGRCSQATHGDSIVQVRAALEALLLSVVEDAVEAIGIDVTDKIVEEVDVLEKTIAEADARGGLEAIRQAREQVASTYGDDGVRIWEENVVGALTTTWPTTLVQKIDADAKRVAQQHTREVDDVKHEMQNRQSLFDEKTKDEAHKFAQLSEELEHVRESVDKEKATSQELRDALTMLRTQCSEMQAASLVVVDNHAEAEGTNCSRLDHANELLEEATRVRAEHIVELETLRVQYTERCEEVETLRDECAAVRQREDALKDSWNKGLAALRAEADAAKSQHEERSRKQRTELQTLRDSLEQFKAQTVDLTDANARLQEEKEREVRQAMELAERHRTSSETSQERVVSMHRSMLNDLKARDEQMREMQLKYSTEQMESQSRHNETTRALEVKNGENATLKRRIEQLEAYDDECKRLRVQVQQLGADKIRMDAEVQNVERRVDSATKERDALRTANMKMENELAVLRAEKQLHEARRAIQGPSSAEDETPQA